MNVERIKWIISGLDFNDLNDWEVRFVESVEKYFKRHGNLTEAQGEKLEEIFRDKSR